MAPAFSEHDFDAYAPAKWRSNVWNRDRLEVKQKLGQLARALAPEVTSVDGEPLQLDESSEHPALWNHKQVDAQHVFFARTQAARRELDRLMDRARSMTTLLDDPTPQRNHLFLTVALDEAGLEVALKLHPEATVDRRNLEARLADGWERARFVELVRGLPTGFRFGVTGGARGGSRGLAERGAEGQQIAAPALDDAGLAAVLAAFAQLPPSTPATWLAIGRTIPRAEVVALAEGIDARLRADLAALCDLYRYGAWTRDNDAVALAGALKQEREVRRQKGLVPSDRVRIVKGLFAGRAGVVTEVDARGALRVLVGKLAVKVSAEEVERVEKAEVEKA